MTLKNIYILCYALSLILILVFIYSENSRDENIYISWSFVLIAVGIFLNYADFTGKSITETERDFVINKIEARKKTNENLNEDNSKNAFLNKNKLDAIGETFGYIITLCLVIGAIIVTFMYVPFLYILLIIIIILLLFK